MTVKAVPTACVAGYACTNAPSWATRSVFYAYDAWGRQTAARYDSVVGGDGVFSGYDGFGRLTSSSTAMNGTSRTMMFGYDADGNRMQMTFPDNQTFTYGYDGLDRENLISQPGGPVVALYYDAAEQPTDIGRANGANTYRIYDSVGRLYAMTHDLVGSSGDLSYGFGYNPMSQIVSRSTSNDAYAWSGASNASKGYAVNGLNQYTSVAGAGYGYDANGNLTSDGSTSYIYDAENRLISASNGSTLTYDPNGRLWQTAGGPSGTTQFFYDGDQLSAEYDGSGNLLRRYVHGTGEDDPLVWYEGGGLNSPRYYHADHQGSIVALSDATGNVSVINSYDEYGVPAPGNQGRFQYTGQTWLPDLGLYHYKARIYSPKLGRMLQTDPVGYRDQANLYGYVANDPLNGRDPMGTFGILGGCDVGSVCTSTDPDASNASATPKQPPAKGESASSKAASVAAAVLSDAASVTADGFKDGLDATLEGTRVVIEVTGQTVEATSAAIDGASKIIAGGAKIVSNKVVRAANAIESWLGGRPTAHSRNGNVRVISGDGNRRFRYEAREKTGSVPPHMHLDQRDARGDMRDAPGTPDHIYPQGQKDNE